MIKSILEFFTGRRVLFIPTNALLDAIEAHPIGDPTDKVRATILELIEGVGDQEFTASHMVLALRRKGTLLPEGRVVPGILNTLDHLTKRDPGRWEQTIYKVNTNNDKDKDKDKG